MNILDRIVEKRREDIEAQKRVLPLEELKRRIKDLPLARDFKGALQGKRCAIIAEVKRRSPSKGRLIEDFQPVRIATLYEKSGAAAISVLTEKHFFEGADQYLTDIKNAVQIPVLRKDFIIDPYQIYETRLLGGDALLLIAKLFEDALRLQELIAIASDLGLAQLVEVHDRAELEKAMAAGADLIGINNRHLETFVTDLQTTIDLKPMIPSDKTVVSESGIHAGNDIKKLMEAGVHAFLIGEALMRSDHVSETMKEFLQS